MFPSTEAGSMQIYRSTHTRSCLWPAFQNFNCPTMPTTQYRYLNTQYHNASIYLQGVARGTYCVCWPNYIIWGERPTSRRPVLPTCKTSIALTVTIFTLFKTITTETNFVMALNRINIVAVTAIRVLHVGKTGRRTVGRAPLKLHVPSPSGIKNWSYIAFQGSVCHAN